MKYIVRSCNKRLAYVQKILIPDLLEQGIPKEDVIHINDDDGEGCLANWLHACAVQSSESCGAWHLQDDVLISENFYDTTKSIPTDVVCNGFVTEKFSPREIHEVGYVPVNEFWPSFQCIYIPLECIDGFLEWFNRKTIIEGKYKRIVDGGRCDDMFFWQYMKQEHRGEKCLNMVPNLVQHIDYMLGGSVANDDKGKRIARSYYWLEEEREEELKERIRRIQI